MSHQGVFTKVLATKLSNQSENIISDSLANLLNSSNPTRSAFLKFISTRLGIGFDDLRFSIQTHHANDAIPDITGKDSENHIKLLIESKFWAGLTGFQPVGYLSLLPNDENSVLLFIVPELRRELVWAELLRRTALAGIEYDQIQAQNDIAYIRTTTGKWLVITSWVRLIDSLIESLDNKDDRDAIADLIQIKGFCQYVDTTAFHPVSPQELDSQIAKRTLQYVNLVDAIINTLYSTKTITGWKSNKSRTIKSSGRYFKYLGTDYYASIQFDLNFWAEHAASPLWIIIKTSKWSFPGELKDLFRGFVQNKHSMMVELADGILLPLWIKPNVEKDEVIADLISQVEEIHQLLPKAI